MTFLALKKRLARRRGANDSTLATATSTRYGDSLNETHRALLRMPGMEPLRYGSITFASVAATQQYALPTQGVARVNRVVDTVNRRSLSLQTLDWLRATNPDPATQQGTPWSYIPTGYVEVHTQPSSAAQIFVKSTSSSDTSVVIYVEGIITGGYYRTASQTLTGTSAVSISSAITNFITLTKCYLSAACVGNVTLHQASGSGTELAKIVTGGVRAQYYSLLLSPTPSSSVTYTCDILRSIPDMANDGDEPLLPEDFHDILIDGAELRELKKQDDPARWQLVQTSYQDGVRSLRSFVIAHPDWRPVLGHTRVGISTLGPYFPADISTSYGGT